MVPGLAGLEHTSRRASTRRGTLVLQAAGLAAFLAASGWCSVTSTSSWPPGRHCCSQVRMGRERRHCCGCWPDCCGRQQGRCCGTARMPLADLPGQARRLMVRRASGRGEARVHRGGEPAVCGEDRTVVPLERRSSRLGWRTCRPPGAHAVRGTAASFDAGEARAVARATLVARRTDTWIGREVSGALRRDVGESPAQGVG